MRTRWTSVLMMAAALCWCTARYGPAQEPEPADDQQPMQVNVTITPAAAPHFALQYRLLPSYQERTPGNAAPYYYRALLHRKNIGAAWGNRYAENYERWLEWPPDEKTLAEMKDWVKAYQGAVFDQLRVAVYREHCDWDFRLRDMEGLAPISFLLEEIQDSRDLARALQIQARVQMMEGQFEAAFESLRTGFQLARDVAQPPTLINSLVGVAIASIMTSELQLLMSQENCPNMYWALATLPAPFIDIRQSMEQEMAMFDQIFPFLKDAETAEHSPEEWRRGLVDSMHLMTSLVGNQEGLTAWQADLGLTGLATVLYPRAKQKLLEAGYPADKVEAMPVAQVIAIQTSRASRYAYHETFKWCFMPYSEAHPFIDPSANRLEEVLGRKSLEVTGALPIAGLLLPALSAASFAPIRLERNLAATRIVEAVRHYAATHDGKLPASLADITDLPIPADPLNLRPISYRVEGDRAILELPSRPGRLPRSEGYQYIIRLRGQ